jgi:alpha-ketoglutarate-dependent taurine dioxygenase
MTYMLSPPGLQIFTMIQPSEQGGESVYADGFAAAETLRNEDADAFCTLSTTVRKYHCIDKATGWHLEAAGPVIELRNGAVIRIRHNDLDRLPDLPPYSETDDGHEIYEKLAHAHTKWDEILGRESTRLLMKLEKGDTVVVANQVGFVCCHAESPVSRMIYLTLMFFL